MVFVSLGAIICLVMTDAFQWDHILAFIQLNMSNILSSSTKSSRILLHHHLVSESRSRQLPLVSQETRMILASRKSPAQFDLRKYFNLTPPAIQ